MIHLLLEASEEEGKQGDGGVAEGQDKDGEVRARGKTFLARMTLPEFSSCKLSV